MTRQAPIRPLRITLCEDDILAQLPSLQFCCPEHQDTLEQCPAPQEALAR